ncbi:MAG: ATP-binding cassette domain-containing protein [Flavipsychrobacter sp.]|nr:ATP-binding cassette domain-containing protein [Flavipsychrobacter sp.]
MQLSLQQVMPIPLRDKLTQRPSGIWRQDLVLQPQEYVFIQAPSGTGKTTLIHILYNLRQDYEGTIKWGADDVKKVSKEQLSSLRTNNISIIFQDMRLFPELTAWENLEIKRALTNTITPQTVEDWLARLGIKDKKNSLAHTLSYGEQQRVSIIRALLQPFNWLLMDEPFSHLDKANTQKACALIKEVVTANNAGLLLADLDEPHDFPYTKTIQL